MHVKVHGVEKKCFLKKNFKKLSEVCFSEALRKAVTELRCHSFQSTISLVSSPRPWNHQMGFFGVFFFSFSRISTVWWLSTLHEVHPTAGEITHSNCYSFFCTSVRPRNDSELLHSPWGCNLHCCIIQIGPND